MNNVLTLYYEGLITETEVHQILDRLQIRGAFRSDGSYIGYDYRNQNYIDTNSFNKYLYRS